MIAFSRLLAAPAQAAGMKMPTDESLVEDFAKARDEFPHWFIFCVLQLGAPMPSASSHWDNAKIIAGIPEEKLKTMTQKDFAIAGVV